MDNVEQPSNGGENSSDGEATPSTLDTGNDESALVNSTVRTPTNTAPSSITSASSLYEDLRNETSNVRGETMHRDATRNASSTRRKTTLENTKFRHVLSPRGTESSKRPVSSTSFEDDSSNRISLRKSALEGTKYHRVLHRGGSDSTDSSRRPAPSSASSMNDNSNGKATLEHAGDRAPPPRRASDVANNGAVVDIERYFDVPGAFSIDAYETESSRQVTVPPSTRSRVADDEESPAQEGPSLQPNAGIPIDQSNFVMVEAQAIDDLAIAEVHVQKWYNRREYRYLLLGGVLLVSSLLVIVIVLVARASASVSATPTPAPIANSQILNDAPSPSQYPVARPTTSPTTRPTTRPSAPPTKSPTTPPYIWSKVLESYQIDSEIAGKPSMALNAVGKVLAIGYLQNTYNYRGAVFVYRLTNATGGGQDWSQMGQRLGGVNASDYFGTSLALSGNGNVLAVGATQAGRDSDNQVVAAGGGYVSVFSFQGASGWVPHGAPLRAGLNTTDGFGYEVALSLDGMILAVLATDYNFKQDEQGGYVKVFHFNKTSFEWDLVDTITKWSSSGDMSMSLSGDGNVIAVGNGADGYAGSIRAWSCDVETGCERLGQELRGDDYEDMIGKAVSLSENGEMLAVGSPGSYDCAWNTPSCVNVKVFSLVRESNPTWTQVGQRLTGEIEFGSRLKISGDGASLVIRVPVCRLLDGCESDAYYRMVTQLYRRNATSASSPWVKVGMPVEADLVTFSSDGSMIAALQIANALDDGTVACYQLDE